MMTTMAAIMGALPIALAIGASSELRQPPGVAVVSGPIVSQALTLFITPVIYLDMEDVSKAATRLGRWLRGLLVHTPANVPAERSRRRGDEVSACRCRGGWRAWPSPAASGATS